jgi:L-ribulose-5-phosphate 4-epimerase
MCEDVARTVLLARTLGELTPLDPLDIDALHDRYQNVYGQPSAEGASAGKTP